MCRETESTFSHFCPKNTHKIFFDFHVKQGDNMHAAIAGTSPLSLASTHVSRPLLPSQAHHCCGGLPPTHCSHHHPSVPQHNCWHPSHMLRLPPFETHPHHCCPLSDDATIPLGLLSLQSASAPCVEAINTLLGSPEPQLTLLMGQDHCCPPCDPGNASVAPTLSRQMQRCDSEGLRRGLGWGQVRGRGTEQRWSRDRHG